MLKNTILSAGLIAAAGMLGVAGASNASIQTFSVTNYNSGDAKSSSAYALNVSVTFTPSDNGNLTIQIFNTSTMLSDSEGVFGVDFSMYNGANLISVLPQLSNGVLVGKEWDATTTGKGQSSNTTYTETSTASDNSQLKSPWEVTSVGSGVYGINVSPSKPHDLVIGSPTNSSGKTTANASVLQHSPSLASGAIFTLTGITGLDGSTTISNVDVIYGTNSSSTGPLGQITAIPTGQLLPIPATLPLVGGGLLGLGLIALRKRRQLQMQ